MTSERQCAMTQSVWVASDAENALVLIKDRASFVIAPCFKQLGTTLIEQKCKRLVLDMEGCGGVDSTFLGVLAGLAARMSRHTDIKMIVFNLSPPIYESICTLGLHRIIDCYETGRCPEDVLENLGRLGELDRMEIHSADSKTTRETAIEAHETLIRANEHNLPRFKDVLTFLRETSKGDKTDQ